MLDIGFLQDSLVGSICPYDIHPGVVLVDKFGNTPVALNQFDGVPLFVHQAKEPVGDGAASRDQHIFDPGRHGVGMLVEALQRIDFPGHMNGIAGKDHTAAVRDKNLPATADHADHQIFAALALEIQELHSGQNAFLRYPDSDDMDPAPEKAFHADSGRIAEHPHDLLGGLQVGVDQGAHTKILSEGGVGRAVIGIGDAGDGLFGTHALSNNGRDKIDLVGARHGQEGMALVDPGLKLRRVTCGIADHT